MTPPRRVEVNPGEMFLIADPTILVAEYESVLADTFKIGTERHDLAYLFTFTGRRNRSDERMTVTVAMHPEDAAALVGQVLDGLELLIRAQQEDTDQEDTTA